MSRQRAETTYLEPGQNSIGRNSARKRGDKYLLDWSIRLHDGRLLEKRSQGATVGETRARARRTAEKLLSASRDGTWTLASLITEYIDNVSRAAILNAPDDALTPDTKASYLIRLNLLMGKCRDHRHQHSLAGHSIGSAMGFRPLEKCLQEISRLHGYPTAKQARTVLGKYVISELRREGLIAYNPIKGERIDMPSPKTASKPARGGKALSRHDYERALDYLLALDPADGVAAPKRGRYTLADRVAVRANVIDLTLLQAATGLRVTEANQLRWPDLVIDGQGRMLAPVYADRSKTKRARLVPILDPRVQHRILERQNRAKRPDDFVIGSPAHPDRQWERGNCRKKTTAFYLELAEKLGIDLWETERTHVWRATLNTLLADSVPDAVRAAYFGHTEEVNRRSYTDVTDVSGMVTAFQRLRAV